MKNYDLKVRVASTAIEQIEKRKTHFRYEHCLAHHFKTGKSLFFVVVNELIERDQTKKVGFKFYLRDIVFCFRNNV